MTKKERQQIIGAYKKQCKADGVTPIISFEDACKVKGLNAKALPDVSMLPKDMGIYLVNHYKLAIIISGINGDWTPKWGEGNWKYYPWFRVDTDNGKKRAGVGLSFGAYVSGNSRTGVGARRVFKTESLAKYAAVQFEKYYQIDLLMKK